MSIHDDSKPSGDKLNDDLHDDKISALYRQLPDEQPSVDTDALLRAAARRAVTAGPRKTVFNAKTQGLLATAATLVLGIALLVQWRSEPEQLHEALATAPASAPAQEALAENPTIKKTPASAHNSDAADALFDDAAPEPASPERNMVAAARAKAAPEPAREPAQEPALTGTSSSGASSGMLNVQPAAAPRIAEEDHADQAEKYMANREDSTRKAKESNSLRMKSEAAAYAAKPAASLPAPAPAPSATASPAPEPLKKQLAADSALEEMKADSTVVKLLPYQAAMQAGNWALAQKSMPVPAQSDAISLQMDRDLVAQLQSSRARPACAALPEAVIGRESLLCHAMILHGEGRALSADILQQLEKAGLITGPMEYRRTAAKALMKN